MTKETRAGTASSGKKRASGTAHPHLLLTPTGAGTGTGTGPAAGMEGHEEREERGGRHHRGQSHRRLLPRGRLRSRGRWTCAPCRSLSTCCIWSCCITLSGTPSRRCRLRWCGRGFCSWLFRYVCHWPGVGCLFLSFPFFLFSFILFHLYFLLRILFAIGTPYRYPYLHWPYHIHALS